MSRMLHDQPKEPIYLEKAKINKSRKALITSNQR